MCSTTYPSVLLELVTLGLLAGGYIAASWATLMFMGQDGYLRKAKQVMTTCQKLQAAVNKIPELSVVGTPHMTGFAMKSIDPKVSVAYLSGVSRAWGCDDTLLAFHLSAPCMNYQHHTSDNSNVLDQHPCGLRHAGKQGVEVRVATVASHDPLYHHAASHRG
jgi:glutamate/tyrosine decarboxylase-like PLP-dependent enzyme